MVSSGLCLRCSCAPNSNPLCRTPVGSHAHLRHLADRRSDLSGLPARISSRDGSFTLSIFPENGERHQLCRCAQIHLSAVDLYRARSGCPGAGDGAAHPHPLQGAHVLSLYLCHPAGAFPTWQPGSHGCRSSPSAAISIRSCSHLGILQQPFLFLSYQNLPAMFGTIVVAESWRATAIVMTILLAGLQVIPRDYFEAADVFGANTLKRTLYVVLPLLRPSLQNALIIRTIFAFQTFSVVLVLAGRVIPSPGRRKLPLVCHHIAIRMSRPPMLCLSSSSRLPPPVVLSSSSCRTSAAEAGYD